MKEFRLTIFNQNRIVFIVFFVPVCLLVAIYWGTEIESFPMKLLAPLISLSVMGFLLFYFAIGGLTVIVENKKLDFNWDKKVIFNYNKIDPIELDQIEILVIDQEQFLRKIITKDRVIKLSNGKIFTKDAQKFIEYLLSETTAKKIDSWDVWKERGWLTIAYRINTVLLIIGGGIVLTYLVLKGFNFRPLLFMPLIISQLLLYQRQMKNKINKK